MEMPKISDETIIEAIQGVIDNFLKPKFISLGMNATGRWLDSLEARAVNGNGEIWGMDYTYWLANGRAPNKDQSIKAKVNFAVWMANGNDVFKSWLAAKGLTEYGVAIAYKIADKGTNYYPNGTDLLDVLNSQEVKQYLIGKFETFFSIEINKILKKQLNDNFARS